MGIFNIFKKKKKEQAKKETPPSDTNIFGMILLEDANSFDMKGTANELRTKWNLSVNDSEADTINGVLGVDDYFFAIMVMDYKIPGDEAKTHASYNYFWKNGIEEVSKHQGHIIVSTLSSGRDVVQENLLYSKVIAAMLNNSKSIGFHMPNRTLILDTNFYLANMEEPINENKLPVLNWIYFGLSTQNEASSIFTYGLTDFGKKEMEIIDANYSIKETYQIMLHLVHYVIGQNITLRHNETVGFSAEQQVKVTESQGVFLEGVNTLKIAF